MSQNAVSPNPFRRFAYVPTSGRMLEVQSKYGPGNENLQVFSGGDLQAFVNDIKVGNMESITWSISVEVVGNYVMGRRDPVLYTTGKRVIVGSMVLSQYDRHALLEQVFQMDLRGKRQIADLWSNNTPAQQIRRRDFALEETGVQGVNPSTLNLASDTRISDPGITLLRGLSPTEYAQQLSDQLTETANLIGAENLQYADQLPPFDVTLVGVNRTGAAAKCTLFGVQVTQETTGYSLNDMGNSVGMSFVCIAVSPWRPVLPNGAPQYRQPSS